MLSGLVEGAGTSVVGMATPHGSTPRTLKISLERSYGLFPALSLTSALGVLIIAIGDGSARAAMPWANYLFWAGLLMLFMPITFRILLPGVPRPERIGLVCTLAIGLYLVKLLHSPLYFAFSDEYQHLRTVQDILQTGYLFQPNPLLLTGSVYPGLSLLAAELSSITGMTAFSSGIIVVGAARLLSALALFFLFEHISGSQRIAGVAGILYSAQPNYLFFDAQFAYESLALPLIIFVLLALARRDGVGTNHRVGLNVMLVMSIIALAMTHHMSAYLLVAFLVLWSAIPILLRRRVTPEASVTRTALFALVVIMTWLIYAASLTIRYLSPVLTKAIAEFLGLLMGETASRELFVSASGQAAPWFERVVGLGGVAVILLLLPFGLVRIWRNYRSNILAVTLAVVALGYPASLVLRLTGGGAETASRTSGSIFIAVSFVVAVALVTFLARHTTRLWALAGATVTTIIFAGGLIAGCPLLLRLPGPYLVGADARSIERQGISTAEWARDVLGPNNRIVADRTNRMLMGTYGYQHTVTNFSDGVNLAFIYFADQFSPKHLKLLNEAKVQYLVVDRRLSQDLPLMGIYFERGEPDTMNHTQPISAAALAKFEGAAGLRRIFDSGDIIIYAIGEPGHEP